MHRTPRVFINTACRPNSPTAVKRPGRRVCGIVLCLLLGLGAASQAAKKPVPVSPGSSTGTDAVSERCPTFLWTAAEGTESLNLVVYAVSEDGPESTMGIVLDVNLPGAATGWTPSRQSCLTPGGRYAWMLRAGDHWSEPNLFGVSVQPSIDEVESALALLQGYLAGAADPADSPLPGTRNELGAASPRGSRPQLPRRSRQPSTRTGRPTILPSGQEPVSVGGTATAAPTLGTPSLSVDGNLSLGAASNLFKDGMPFLWSDSSLGSTSYGSTGVGARALENDSAGSNTAVGHTALQNNTLGTFNTAVGYIALRANEYGHYNTAVGAGALKINYYGGSNNTAVGALALRGNTWGQQNTAVGVYALGKNENSNENTAVGYSALRTISGYPASGNTALGSNALRKLAGGNYNTAMGHRAMFNGTSGSRNTAVGSQALYDNEGSLNTGVGSQALHDNEGDFNTASGHYALKSNSTGHRNTALGAVALESNLTGYKNTAVGVDALRDGTDGQNNTAVGFEAGIDATGSHNVLINNRGTGSESNTLRIGRGTGTGAQELAKAFIHGIYDKPVGGTNHPVYVDSTGQLGKLASSRRFKKEIRDLGDLSAKVLGLRPVTFRFKRASPDAEQPLHFGLIAEEVAEVFPELVDYDEEGLPESVQYQHLSALLLNELQRQHRQLRMQWLALGIMLVVGAGWAIGHGRLG